MRNRCSDESRSNLGLMQAPKNGRWRRGATAGLLLFVMTGCSASWRMQPTVAGYAVTPVDDVPIAVMEGYPRTLYQGRYAYLIDGQWYYPTNDGWVVFLDVPMPLAEYRARLQSAPPATRAPDVYYGYPPTPRQPTPPREIQREYRPR